MPPTLFAECVLALTLLTGDPESKPDPDLMPLLPAACKLAAGLDAAGWVVNADGSFAVGWAPEELATQLQADFWESVPLPPLADLTRLPCRKALDAGWEGACRFVTGLEERLAIDAVHRVELEVYLGEARLLQAVYCAASYAAQDQGRSGLDRRRDLAEVRRLIGDANYYRGQLPPPVPVWRLPDR